MVYLYKLEWGIGAQTTRVNEHQTGDEQLISYNYYSKHYGNHTDEILIENCSGLWSLLYTEKRTFYGTK